MLEKVPNSLQGILLHCFNGDPVLGPALARLVPGNLFWFYDDNERIQGEAEVGVKVGAGQQAPLGVRLSPFSRHGWLC